MKTIPECQFCIAYILNGTVIIHASNCPNWGEGK